MQHEEPDMGFDPKMTRYFKKILNSFSLGMLWLLVAATAGLYFRLAFIEGGLRWYNILFYLLFITTFILLLRYYYKTWKEYL